RAPSAHRGCSGRPTLGEPSRRCQPRLRRAERYGRFRARCGTLCARDRIAIARRSSLRTRWFAVFFFFSGFCSLLYEVIWVRLGMAHFGVTTPVVSIFLSLFMAGLGLGSWLSGLWMRRIGERATQLPLRLYALAELTIGFSTLAVPVQLAWAKSALESHGSDLS